LHIYLADHAGFCYGVKRAVDLALNAPAEEGPWYTLGPLVHNREVVGFLADKGIASVDDIDEITDGGVIIRSHGIPQEVQSEIESRGLRIIDATCPHVKQVQELAQKLVDEHYQVVIVGDKDHPEVQGIWSRAGNNSLVARMPEDVADLPPCNKIAVICQTTIQETEYRQVVQALISHAREIRGYNTICNASLKRQEAVAELAGHVDLMIVIGDRKSSNTRSLVKICEDREVATYQIETAEELRPEWFEGKKDVGVTAGASTPDWVIKEVLSRMSELESNYD